MYGFAAQRKQLLEVELERLSIEMPPLGAMRVSLTGDLAVNRVTPETALELVVIQATDQPFRRRADFWTTHLRPRIGINFFVYTPDEFENPSGVDPLLRDAANNGEKVYG